jgi:hypothetical protein
MTTYLLPFDSYGLVFWSVLSDERTGLSFVYAAGPRPRSLSRVRVPSDSWPYLTVLDLRLPFSSPPTTRRVTVEVFEPASTRVTKYFEVKVMLRPTVQLASPSWIKAPIWGLRPDLYYCQTVAGLLIWGALSDEGTGLSFARLNTSIALSLYLLIQPGVGPNIKQVAILIVVDFAKQRLFSQPLLSIGWFLACAWFTVGGSHGTI